MANYKAKTAYRDRETAESYDEARFTSPQGKLIDTIERNAVNRLIDEIDQRGLLLDLASGSGRFTDLALMKGNLVVAADISLNLLKLSRQRIGTHKGLTGLILCDAEHLPFKDNAFDCVTAIRFMGMIPQSVRHNIFLEIGRVSRKWVIFNLPNNLSTIILPKVIWKLKRERREYYSISPWQLRKELRNTGFHIISRERPLLVPPRRFPTFFLGIIKAINRLGNHSVLGYLSEQYFLLVERCDSL